MKLLDNNNVLTDPQQTFRKREAVKHNSFMLSRTGQSILNRAFKSIPLFKILKTLNTVPHDLLKLHSYSVLKQVLNWIAIFLSDRTQSYVVNGSSSNKNQCSFCPSRNRLRSYIFFTPQRHSSMCRTPIWLFAVDCICYRIIRNFKDCSSLQKDIDRLGKWIGACVSNPQNAKWSPFLKREKHHLCSKLVFLDKI